MSTPVRVWIAAAFYPVYRCGGWALVRNVQGVVSGMAGGERHSTGMRVALAGLAAGLQGLPAAADAIEIQTTSPELAALAAFLSAPQAPGAKPPGDDGADLDFWAQILTAAKGRRLSVVAVAPQPKTPAAFAGAWADLARDKAKATGPFTAAIPKPNLAKVQGLG